MQQMLLFSENESFLTDSFSANGFFSDYARKELEKHFCEKIETTDYFNRKSVSFQLSKNDILHSWLRYKEGFSANLVNFLLDEFCIQSGEWIMDPFMGSGTTALVCQMRGINCIGYDVMPISTISIRAKAAVMRYDLHEIENILHALYDLKMPSSFNKHTPYITITEGAYPDENSKFIQFITDWINQQNFSDISKNLLRLCIINSLERCSYTIKSGQYLGWDARSPKILKANRMRAEQGIRLLPTKYVRETIQDAKTTILHEFYHFYEDIKAIQKIGLEAKPAKIDFVQNSVLYELPSIPNDFLSGVITSPPYCNRYDYTRTYALELVYLGLDDNAVKNMRQTLLSCTVESHSKMDELRMYYDKIGCGNRFEYISKTIKNNSAFSEIMMALNLRKKHGDLNNNGVVRMVEGYFTELAFIYAELYRVCKKGASVAFVNDNVRYGGEVIPVDFLSSSFAEQFGFQIKKIYTLKQQKGNSSQQMAKFGRVPLRKSITVWTKE